MPVSIELKTDSPVFRDVVERAKRFELRRNDRDFQVGQEVLLRETRYTGAEMAAGAQLVYTGATALVRITYVLDGPIYGLQADWCIFAFDLLGTAGLD